MKNLRRISPDLWLTLLLIALWIFFFWRIFTPFQADQVSLKQGDFSGQFVTFGGYQYDRLTAGEIPLWNPYNNGGLPFIADTQAAVFYPPRLATIALAHLSGGWSYHALELEMTAHVLAYTLMMYAFIRRLTLGQRGSYYGAFVAALISGYSGFMSGYAPLQLAVLEAAVWLPLALIGIVEATREKLNYRWLILTGFTLGVSWMAGHPQTSFFITYLLVAYFAYRIYKGRFSGVQFILGTTLFGLIAFGITAVQLLPGAEYLINVTRIDFGYDAKANGFPFQDIAQFIFPSTVSVFSPLYVGFIALVFVAIAISRQVKEAFFWGIIALFALLWSFGGNSIVFPLLYNIMPGLRFFRGQERAAYLVMNSLAILAGLGAINLINWDHLRDQVATANIRKWLGRTFIACFFVAALIFAGWLGYPEMYAQDIKPVSFALIIIGLSALAIPLLIGKSRSQIAFWVIPAIIALELFTINANAPSTYDAIPPEAQISVAPPPLITQALADTGTPFRVDGRRGLTANYGSLYRLQDIRGISPLWFSDAWALIEGDLPIERAWELFAVRYVFTDWNELPAQSEIIGTGADFYGEINLHQLSDPRPFAQVMYRQWQVTDETEAYNWLRDPAFPARDTVILEADPQLNLVDGDAIAAQVTHFAPEAITIQANTPQDGILSIALVAYPGWQATLNGQPAEILRAYGGLSAIPLPQGEHLIELVYNPLSYRIGAVISSITWAGVILSGFIILLTRRAGRTQRG